jgi:hypothetical protein
MPAKKFTRNDINKAMLKAKAEATKKYTIETLRAEVPRGHTHTMLKDSEDLEYSKSDAVDLQELIDALLSAQRLGATHLTFSWDSYEYSTELTIDFRTQLPETDAEYKTRIDRIRYRKIESETERVKFDMDRHNSEVSSYLDLKKKFID